MKKNYFLFFVLLMIFFAGKIQAQTITPVPYYSMLNWDTSPYESFRYTRPTAAWEWINFRMLFPNGYDSTANDGKEYPLIIMLHGAGESGRMEWNNSTRTNSPYPAGDPRIDNNDHHLLFGGREHLNAVKSGRFPGFVVFPQNFYGTWVDDRGQAANPIHRDLQKVLELAELLVQKLKIDPSRIYIHGLSNGGAGTWYAAYARPDLFAAALPMSAPGDPAMAEQLALVPLWVFQGELDTNPRPWATKQTVDAVRNAGGTVRYTEYGNTAHNTWNKAYSEPDFFEWMLQQSKLPPNQLPTAKAGGDVILTHPQDSTTLIGVATDPDGRIVSYQWEKLDGPAVTMDGENTANLNLMNLVEGGYLFRFTATDDRGGEASDEVVVTVNGGGTEPENEVPVVYAGDDKSITLPTNTATLTATASDSDGTIASYLWEKVSGPAVTMSNQTTSALSLSGLTEGEYTFRVTVKDNEGAVASDQVVLEVKAESGGTTSCQALVMNGSNQLPLSSSMVLSGNFTIEYWAKLSGSITNADAPVSGGSNQFINYYNAQARLYSRGASGGHDPVISSHKTVAGEWTHYAFVREGSNMKVYINGVEDTGAKATNQWAGDLTLTNLGSGYNGNFAGELDELRIWSVARSGSQIQSNYNSSIGAGATGLKAYYNFEETAGVVKDISGNGYDSQSVPAGISRAGSAAPLTDCGVVSEPNQLPVVKAGDDRIITLPTNTATLTATASDSDGTIVSYLWEKVSGPAVTMSNQTTSALSLSGLTEGEYTFRVTVKDNEGAIATDEVNLIVNEAPVVVVGAAKRINVAGRSLTAYGEDFSADQYFSGGRAKSYSSLQVSTPSGTETSGLYHSERYGDFTYSIPVSSGTYLLRLHFAEVYWNRAGKRLFSVEAEGNAVLTNYDIFAEAGFSTAVVKEFEVSVTDGQLDLEFITAVDNAKVSAIEVLEVTSGGNNLLAAPTATSRLEVASQDKVTVYPNTFENEVKVRIDSEEEEGTYEISVFDFQGRSILKEQMDFSSAAVKEYVLDFSGIRMPSGTYLIQIREKNAAYTEVIRVVKK